MSRIAGIISKENSGGNSLEKIHNRISSQLPGDVKNWVRLGNASLLACRWQNSEYYHYSNNHLSVVIDGKILNRDNLCSDFSLDDADGAFLCGLLYQKIGFEEMVKRIIGECTIGLYDHKEDCLYLGRDRIGVKPLYYHRSDKLRAFSSQPFSLLGLPGISKTPNPAFVSRFLGLHYRLIDNDRHSSPFQDLRQLPAGSWAKISNNGTELHTYWDLYNQPNWQGTETELAAQYRDRLLTAVERRYKAATNPLFTLSGGLDSSSVLCSAATISGQNQEAISSVYTDKTYDERDEIQDVVKKYVSTWSPVELENDIDIFDYISLMVRIHNEPVATATWLSHFQLCQEISTQAPSSTLFGGLGGDELNAGEYEYFPMLFADLKQEERISSYNHEVGKWAEYHDHPIFKKDAAVAEKLLKNMTDPASPGRIYHDPQRMLKYAHTVNTDYFDITSFQPVMDAPFNSYLKNRTYQDLIRETTPCCLRAEDRQCSHFGIEHADPFLDHELVEFMFRVPGNMKIRDGITKRLLREAMKDILPEPTRNRIAKTGWNAPAHMWFTGENLNRLRDMVSSQSFSDRGIYNVESIITIINEHETIVSQETNEENHMMFLWQLLNTESWLKEVDKLG
ncbi:asparagine synthetase B family protein [Kiloniella majae]|uniref:asparagine synthetase B family protein n=1 Tax=Kiloniella majae TaxID=1938558 RepID=UPI000A278491|nr:asparagine synthase-related protein [Kiloniella majae]